VAAVSQGLSQAAVAGTLNLQSTEELGRILVGHSLGDTQPEQPLPMFRDEVVDVVGGGLWPVIRGMTAVLGEERPSPDGWERDHFSASHGCSPYRQHR
jgi:hypothetical protein